ncbi:MAG: TonB-dependent receptor plug domain-containing protein, partial [Ginsengibacter sp.]
MRKIIKKLTLAFIFLATLNISYAQTKEVSGQIMDGSAKTIAGASVIAKGTTSGTSTNDDGKFTLQVPAGVKALLVSALNYASQEVPITASPMAIILKNTVLDLEEVIVVGYGTQKVTKVSGAISTIKEADIEKLKPVRVEDALQGRASGVTVISNGSPGSKPTVLIRGIPSFSGTDPVVIIDGIPQTLDDFNAVNSEDIASINVLKDAAATAIYGVKG